MPSSNTPLLNLILLIDVTFSTPTGLLTTLRFLFAKIGVSECYCDFSTVMRNLSTVRVQGRSP